MPTVLKVVGYSINDSSIQVSLRGMRPPSSAEVEISDSELNGAATQDEVIELIRNKLDRKINGDNIRSKLDPVIGMSVTV